jgi:hypothetical protein
LETISPLVEKVYIDEAYLDVTGLERLMGPPEVIGRLTKERIREAVGLTASVGIGPNRLIAEFASDADKPDGLTVVLLEKVCTFLDPMPLSALRGVGGKTAPRLERLGALSNRILGRPAGTPDRGRDFRLGRGATGGAGGSVRREHTRSLSGTAAPRRNIGRHPGQVRSGNHSTGSESAKRRCLKALNPDLAESHRRDRRLDWRLRHLRLDAGCLSLEALHVRADVQFLSPG